MTTVFVFNQYYIDFLKRIKDVAKKNKETSSTSRSVLKAIKEHYTTLDKASDEYLAFVSEQINNDIWDSYVSSYDTWFEANKDLMLFKDISIDSIRKLLDDDYLCHHFLTVFFIFKNELEDELSSKIVKILQSIDGKELLDEIEDASIKQVLTNLHEIRNKKIKEKAGIDMNFIEDTTLGKLAKEILEDIDVGKLQKSMGDSGDVLKAIGDPDSGFADIITNVSKKMATKISNGELKQENLIQDAMKFASIMPNLFGTPSGTPSGTSPSKSPGGQDLSGIMSMMSSLMGDNKDTDFSSILKNMKRTQNGTRRTVNENALKKIAKAKKLKKKLFEKKKAAQEESANQASDE
jgi:hypothetical protein